MLQPVSGDPGVFSGAKDKRSGEKRRHEVVPRRPTDPAQTTPPAAPGEQLALPALGNPIGAVDGDDHARPAARNRWAWLLAHVFRADLDTCPRCSGPMRWLEAATAREAIARLLAKHGLAPQPPPKVRRVVAAQLDLPFMC